MTIIEQEEFKAEFASIVFWFGIIKSDSAKLRQLECYNKNGSHDKAILKAIDFYKEHKATLKEKLKGKSYEDWRTFSKNLTVIRSKIKRSVNDATKRKWQNELDNLKF